MPQFPGQYQDAIEFTTAVIRNCLANQPGPTGDLTSILTISQIPDGTSQGEGQGMPVCVVTIEPGWDDMAMGDESPMGLYDPLDEYNLTPNSPTTVFLHHMVSYDARLLFRLYMPSDFERRYWADMLKSRVETAYFVGPDLLRTDGAVIKWLRAANIIPKKRLWEPIEFPPPESGEDRPFGQPFTANLRLNCDLYLSWTTPVNRYASQISLSSYAAMFPPFLGPPTQTFSTSGALSPLFGGTATVETLPVALNGGASYPCQQVLVQCPITSLSALWVGTAFSQDMELVPGSAALALPVTDLQQVYVRASSTGTVSWLAVR